MTEDLSHDSVLKIIDILNKAIVMERNTKEYYETAADFTRSVEGKKMFQWLANFEDSHERRLITRRAELLKHPALKGESLPINHSYKISEADSSRSVPANASERDVLQIGLENEYRVYAFFQKKTKAAQNENIRDFFMIFVKDTDRHIKILEDQLHSIKVNDLYKAFDDYL